MCFPLVEYLPVKETAAPKIILSPTTFEKEIEVDPKIRAIADIDSEILFIPAEKMNEWFETEPSWRNFILESYQIRFNEMLETIETLAFLKMDERLHKYIIDKIKVQGHTSLHITHQEIAEDLNTSRVVVSRLLKQLENQNLIKLFRNKIEVLKF